MKVVEGRGNSPPLTDEERRARRRGWKFGAWVMELVEKAHREVDAEINQRAGILGVPMSSASEPTFIASAPDAPREGQPFVEREAITAIVRDTAGRYLGLRWKEVDWETFITGGIEEGQSPEEAARAEIREETGYKHLRLVKELPRFHSKFFHHPKGVNRFAHFHSFLFELEDDERDTVSEDERKKHDCVWLSEDELARFRLPEGHRYLLGQV